MPYFDNPTAPLTLPNLNPFSPNSVIHVGFIDFLTQHGLASWGGYRYWLATTPYPGNDEEDPCILASNDLSTWVVPAGLSAPLTDIGDNGYTNDPQILYDPDTDRIRYYHGQGTGAFPMPWGGTAGGCIWGFEIAHSPLRTVGTLAGEYTDGDYSLYGQPYLPGLAMYGHAGQPLVVRLAADSWAMYSFPVGHNTTLTTSTVTAGRVGFHTAAVGWPWFPSNSQDVYWLKADGTPGVPAFLNGVTLDHCAVQYKPGGLIEFVFATSDWQHLFLAEASPLEPHKVVVRSSDWLLSADGASFDPRLYQGVILPTETSDRRLVYSAYPYNAPYRIGTATATVSLPAYDWPVVVVVSVPARFLLASEYLRAAIPYPVSGGAGSDSGAAGGGAIISRPASGGAGSTSGASGDATIVGFATFSLASEYLAAETGGAVYPVSGGAGSTSGASGDASRALPASGTAGSTSGASGIVTLVPAGVYPVSGGVGSDSGAGGVAYVVRPVSGAAGSTSGARGRYFSPELLRPYRVRLDDSRRLVAVASSRRSVSFDE